MAAKKILIADDESRMRKLIKDYLRRDGFEVIEAADGLEALAQFDLNPDTALIIMDVMMPKLDGYGALKKIRETSQVPVIILTAKSEEEDALEGFTAGADEFVTKPFSPKVLVARVRAILNRGEGSGAVTGTNDGKITCGKIVLDEEKCNNCGRCVKACPTDAWKATPAFEVSFGGLFGNRVYKGENYLPLVTSEEQLFRITDAAIQFFDDNANPGERFRMTLERVGLDKFEEKIKEAYNG